MPRGSNSEVEQDRIKAGDKLLNTRMSGNAAGTGAPAHEKMGYGGAGSPMQKNPSGNPKESL